MNGKDSLLDIYITTFQCNKNKDKALKATWKKKIKVICRKKARIRLETKFSTYKTEHIKSSLDRESKFWEKNGIESEIQYIIQAIIQIWGKNKIFSCCQNIYHSRNHFEKNTSKYTTTQ